jgi:hypothetical protein
MADSLFPASLVAIGYWIYSLFASPTPPEQQEHLTEQPDDQQDSAEAVKHVIEQTPSEQQPLLQEKQPLLPIEQKPSVAPTPVLVSAPAIVPVVVVTPVIEEKPTKVEEKKPEAPQVEEKQPEVPKIEEKKQEPVKVEEKKPEPKAPAPAPIVETPKPTPTPVVKKDVTKKGETIFDERKPKNKPKLEHIQRAGIKQSRKNKTKTSTEKLLKVVEEQDAMDSLSNIKHVESTLVSKEPAVEQEQPKSVPPKKFNAMPMPGMQISLGQLQQLKGTLRGVPKKQATD